MKKVLLFGLVLIATVTISACKKDRVCTCTSVFTGSFSGTISADTSFANVSKGDAETKCSALDFSATIDDESVTSTCELKK